MNQDKQSAPQRMEEPQKPKLCTQRVGMSCGCGAKLEGIGIPEALLESFYETHYRGNCLPRANR
jgi:hypothetical protein